MYVPIPPPPARVNLGKGEEEKGGERGWDGMLGALSTPNIGRKIDKFQAERACTPSTRGQNAPDARGQLLHSTCFPLGAGSGPPGWICFLGLRGITRSSSVVVDIG